MQPPRASRCARALALAIAFLAAAPSAFAVQKIVLGPVAFEAPEGFAEVAGPPPALHEEASGVTLEVSELPLKALDEFKGPVFLDFLTHLGYANPTYAEGLKRSDAYTYVLADAKGKDGPEQRFLLVLGGSGRAAIITAYAPKSRIEAGKASRAGIETILSAATIVPASVSKPE